MTSRVFSITLLGAGLVACSGIYLNAQDPSADRMKSGGMSGSADSAWMMKAAQGGMAEVQIANVAKDHASSDAVKMFAQHMIDDHTKANDELKSLAAQKNVTLPSDLDAKDKMIMDKLSKMHGAAFDKAYMKDMVADHKKDIAEFHKEASGGKDPDVKAWAAQTLPTLQSHLQMAMDTEKQAMSGAKSKM